VPATREQLREHLSSFGYLPSGHLRSWPEGSLNYYWLERQEYKSFDGVEATIFPVASEKRDQYGGCEWALHTRTRVAASSFDLEQQNTIIRTARKKFGGFFINDAYGKNRYTPVEKDTRGPIGRGIFLSYEFVKDKLEILRYALPGPMIQNLPDKDSKIGKWMSQNDPARVLYNALVPFTVAALEHFFGQSFKIILRYDEKAQKRLLEQTRKIDMQDVIAIAAKEKTIEDVIADWYSFQNIQSITVAFKEWFNIDLWKILRRRKRVGRRVFLLEKQMNTIIQFRHGLIHRFEFDLDLNQEQIAEVIDTTLVLIETFIDYLEKERGIKVRD
jgi:hypothetical protein